MTVRRCVNCLQPVRGHIGKFGKQFCRNIQNQTNDPPVQGLDKANDIFVDKKEDGRISVYSGVTGKLEPMVNDELVKDIYREVEMEIDQNFTTNNWQEDIKNILETINRASQAQTTMAENTNRILTDDRLEKAIRDQTEAITSKPKEIKDPICPKLKLNQKLETYWREVDTYEKEMFIARPHKETAELVMKREMIKCLKECEVEEVKKFTLEHILEMEENMNTIKDIKNKIEERFGQTSRQKDVETRTRFMGLKLEGNITDFVNYMARERKNFHNHYNFQDHKPHP